MRVAVVCLVFGLVVASMAAPGPQQILDKLKEILGEEKFNEVIAKLKELKLKNCDRLKEHLVQIGVPEAQLEKILAKRGCKTAPSENELLGLNDESYALSKQELVQKLKELLGDRFDKFVQKWKELKGKLCDRLSQALTKLGVAQEKIDEILSKKGCKSGESDEEIVAFTFETTLVKILSEKLQAVINSLKEAIAHGQAKYQEILDKAQKLLEELTQHGGSAVDTVKKFLTEILGSIIGKREADDALDQILSETEEDAMLELTSEYFLPDIIGGIKDTISGIISSIKGRFQELSDFFKKWIGGVGDATKPHVDNIKELAKDFLEHINDASAQVKEEALKFFGKYKNDLGKLWQQIKDSVGTIG